MIQETLTTILGILRKHGIFLIVFFWLVAVLYVGLRDKSPEIIFSQDYFIAILTIIPVLIAIMFGFGLIKSFDLKTLTPMQITKIITSILAIAGIFYGIWYLNTPRVNLKMPLSMQMLLVKLCFFLILSVPLLSYLD